MLKPDFPAKKAFIFCQVLIHKKRKKVCKKTVIHRMLTILETVPQ